MPSAYDQSFEHASDMDKERQKFDQATIRFKKAQNAHFFERENPSKGHWMDKNEVQSNAQTSLISMNGSHAIKRV